jgi:hypothetical protein
MKSQRRRSGTNAKKELLDHLIDHIKDRDVLYVRVHYTSYGNGNERDEKTIEGSLKEVLDQLDFYYDSGYGARHLEGTIWYKDGTWSSRVEYGGAEWWEYFKCPDLVM